MEDVRSATKDVKIDLPGKPVSFSNSLETSWKGAVTG